MIWGTVAVLLALYGWSSGSLIVSGLGVLAGIIAVRRSVMRWNKPGALVGVVATVVAGVATFSAFTETELHKAGMSAAGVVAPALALLPKNLAPQPKNEKPKLCTVGNRVVHLGVDGKYWWPGTVKTAGTESCSVSLFGDPNNLRVYQVKDLRPLRIVIGTAVLVKIKGGPDYAHGNVKKVMDDKIDLLFQHPKLGRKNNVPLADVLLTSKYQ